MMIMTFLTMMPRMENAEKNKSLEASWSAVRLLVVSNTCFHHQHLHEHHDHHDHPHNHPHDHPRD